MSRIFISHLRISLFGLSARAFSSTPNPRNATCTRHLIRYPSPAAIRESPTPLVFVRARGLGYANTTAGTSTAEGEEDDWTEWSGMFAEKGYTALELDISAPTTPASATAETPTETETEAETSGSDSGSAERPAASPLGAMTSLLASQIRLMAIPFPPVIIASGQSCLLTQAYIEDNPASGLVLIDPPPDDPSPNRPSSAQDGWAWPKFNYEPKFPILVMEGEGTAKAARLAKAAEGGVGRGGKGVTLEPLRDGHRGEKSRIEVERWLDRSGF